MQIRPVENKKDLQTFIELPYRLYRKDPLWVAPLRSEQWSQFDAKKIPCWIMHLPPVPVGRRQRGDRAHLGLHRQPGAETLAAAHRTVRFVRMHQ